MAQIREKQDAKTNGQWDDLEENQRRVCHLGPSTNVRLGCFHGEIAIKTYFIGIAVLEIQLNSILFLLSRKKKTLCVTYP